MKGYAMLGIGKTGWIEKERPLCGPLDAIVRPIAVSPCTSDVHTVLEGAIGDRHNMILGHEAVGEVVEVGRARARLQVRRPRHHPCHHARLGCARIAAGLFHALRRACWRGWKFSNFKDGVFAEFFHVNEADANMAHLPADVDPVAAVMLADMVPTGLPRRGAGRCAVRR